MNERMDLLLAELEKLHARLELSKTIQPDYFEPGMMEHLDQYEGRYDASTGEILLRFGVKGTRYEGRTEAIEAVKLGDSILVVRQTDNPHNPNNFTLVADRGQNVGNMPADLCDALAPLVDAGVLAVESACISYVEPLSRRSRYAKQAVLFVELHLRQNG